jgi:phosphoglycerate dehydrogenase-like enzyme
MSELHRPDKLLDLLPHAHAVIVCASLTPQTKGLFDEKVFRAMREDAIFLNRGPGQIVQHAALERALTEGWIAGAGMDALAVQPLPPDSPLWDRDNVIVTPHVATMGRPSQDRRLRIVLDNVRKFASGEPVANVVDKNAWAKG